MWSWYKKNKKLFNMQQKLMKNIWVFDENWLHLTSARLTRLCQQSRLLLQESRFYALLKKQAQDFFCWDWGTNFISQDKFVVSHVSFKLANYIYHSWQIRQKLNLMYSRIVWKIPVLLEFLFKRKRSNIFCKAFINCF